MNFDDMMRRHDEFMRFHREEQKRFREVMRAIRKCLTAIHFHAHDVETINGRLRAYRKAKGAGPEHWN